MVHTTTTKPISIYAAKHQTNVGNRANHEVQLVDTPHMDSCFVVYYPHYCRHYYWRQHRDRSELMESWRQKYQSKQDCQRRYDVRSCRFAPCVDVRRGLGKWYILKFIVMPINIFSNFRNCSVLQVELALASEQWVYGPSKLIELRVSYCGA